MTAPPTSSPTCRSCARASGSPPRCTATPNNYAYFGDRHGASSGLWRHSASRPSCGCASGEGARAIRRFEGINGALGAPPSRAASTTHASGCGSRPGSLRPMPGRPSTSTSRPKSWSAPAPNACSAPKANLRAWSPPTSPAADQPVPAEALHQPARPGHGGGAQWRPDRRLARAQPQARRRRPPARLNAAESADALVRATYAPKSCWPQRPWRPAHRDPDRRARRSGGDGFARIRDDAGLDWIVMVAVPRDDFLHSITQNFYITLAVALILPQAPPSSGSRCSAP